VCSSNHFAYYAPVFIYSIKKEYPDAGVKVFVMGKLKPEVSAILDKLRDERLIDTDWEVIEDRFSSYPTRVSTCNSLRFLLPKDSFEGYDYIIIRDIDFIVLPQTPSHFEHFKTRLDNVKSCMFGMRGPYRFPRRPEINIDGWKGDYSRIAGGLVVLKNPEWFNKTKDAVKEYRQYLKHSQHDNFDHHIAGSYREYDEVMLYRICKKSHVKVPTKKSKGVDGKGISKIYRDIHLGDFNKSRYGFKKMKKKIAPECVKKYMKLEQDPVWQEVKAVASTNPKVRKVLKAATKHIRSR
jgi:hypothetical protein